MSVIRKNHAHLMGVYGFFRAFHGPTLMGRPWVGPGRPIIVWCGWPRPIKCSIGGPRPGPAHLTVILLATARPGSAHLIFLIFSARSGPGHQFSKYVGAHPPGLWKFQIVRPDTARPMTLAARPMRQGHYLGPGPPSLWTGPRIWRAGQCVVPCYKVHAGGSKLFANVYKCLI